MKKTGRVVRCICLLDHPIPNTKDALSTQLILPQKQRETINSQTLMVIFCFSVGRKSDIYISCVSYTHQVSAKGWFVAMISTSVETDNPEAEIQPGLNLLGPIKQKFLEVRDKVENIVELWKYSQVSDAFEPTDDGTANQLFISKTYDATSHFETTCIDVLDIFKRGTGEEFDFSKVKHTLEDQE